MTHGLPVIVVYLGLAVLALALAVVAAQNKCSLRVFFLVALRLAIGWHFLFEGLHKINTHELGVTEWSKPFTSEPYFKASPTGLGELMARKFNDPQAVIAARVRIDNAIPLSAFAKLDVAGQAAACPVAVSQSVDSLLKEAEARLEVEAKMEPKVKPESAFAAIQTAKAKYARWVYGVDGRDAKVKFTTGEASLTAPQRLAHIDWLRGELNKAEAVRDAGIGNGNGVETKRVAELRMELATAESDLAKDANAFVAELRKELAGKDMPEEKPEPEGKRLDRVTMWFIAGVGACLMLGLFTRLACVLAAGFLIMTYILHPPFPWYPLPPNTEGNPLFINKNVIEALALLALACFPTGRWLGLDALLCRLLPGRFGTCQATSTSVN